MKKRLIALLLVVVILAAYVPKVSASGKLWFIAVNDRMPMTLTDDAEPFFEDDTLYIPYFAFDAKPFTVTHSYNSEKKETLTLFNRAKYLHFDLKKKTCTDKDGNTSDVEVKFRRGVLYLPADSLEYFGIDVAVLINNDGYLVLRFTNGSQVYDDDVFLALAEQLINYRAERYDDGTLPPEDEVPDVQQPDDITTPKPGDEPEGYAYLAFYGEAVSELSVKLLELENLRGTFFLTEEQIRQDPALVRLLYAAGSTIGLLLDEAQTDAQLALDSANNALDEVLFRKTLLALTPETLDQPIVGYRVLKMPALEQPPEENADAGKQTQFLAISDANINYIITQLATEKIQILPLRENSPIA